DWSSDVCSSDLNWNLTQDFTVFVDGHHLRSVINNGRNTVTDDEVGFIVIAAVDTISQVHALDININVDLSAWLPILLRAPAHLIVIEPVKRTFYLRRGGDCDCFL